MSADRGQKSGIHGVIITGVVVVTTVGFLIEG